MFLYKLTFESGKEYVGQTVKTVEHRFNHHRNSATAGSVLPVHCAWRKYGDPVVGTLGSYGCQGDLNVAEVEAIANCGSLVPGGYNVALGGHDGTPKSPIVRAKIAAAATGRVPSEETKALLAVRSAANWQCPDYRAKVAAGVANSFTPERRLAISANAKKIHTGKIVSEETREKLRNRIISEETRAKMSAASKGRKRGPVSAETRAKLSKSAALTWTDKEHSKLRAERIKAAHANRTPENRSEAARRAWVTKRTKGQLT